LYQTLTNAQIDNLIADELARFPEVENTPFAFSRDQLLGSFVTFQVTNTTELDLSIDDTDWSRASWAHNSKIVCVEKETPLLAFLDADEDTSTTDDQTLTTVYMNKYEIQAIDPRLPVGFLKATATHRGKGKDNPLTSTRLSKLQLDRSITFVFKDTERMAIVQQVLRMPTSQVSDNDGRNFLFSFEDPARQICDAWRQPPSPPQFPPGTYVTYVVEQEYYLKRDSWPNGYDDWDTTVIKALEEDFKQGMNDPNVGTSVTSVRVFLPVEVPSPSEEEPSPSPSPDGEDGSNARRRQLEPFSVGQGDAGSALVIRFHTAELINASVTLDAYFSRLVQVNRGALQKAPPQEEGQEGGYGLVANGLPSFRPLSSMPTGPPPVGPPPPPPVGPSLMDSILDNIPNPFG
jgi:hypothetical protein